MILDITSLAATRLADIRERVTRCSSLPKLVVVMVGDNPASTVYVRNKVRKCAEAGMLGEVLHFDTTFSEEALL